MPSPFPGMDPFLEHRQRWPLFHGWFMRELARLSLDRAKEQGLWITVERSSNHRGPRGEHLLVGESDLVGQLEVDTSTRASRSGIESGTLTLTPPRAVHEVKFSDEEAERAAHDYLVVREFGRESRILAVVELLNHATKTGVYASHYQERRSRVLQSALSFVEFDFLRFGENPSRDLFPEWSSSYFIFVSRKTGLGRDEEGFPINLRDPLPVVGVPIGPNREDLPLDVTAAFHAAYELAVRPGSINYRQESVPPPDLSPEDDDWLARTVRS